jgi:hypothetical protein
VDVPKPGFQKYWRQALSLLKSESHARTNKYPEAVSVVQQVHKVISDTDILAKCTPARMGESSQWTTILKSAEENRAKFCKFLDWKMLFSALYSMYKVTRRTAGSPEGGYTNRIKWSSEQNLTGINGSG